MTVVADITKGPIPDVADNSSVVFVSCVLEYVTDIDAALREISRIAGSADNVFVVTVQPWTLTARLYPGARWRGTVKLGTVTQAVQMAPVGLEEKLPCRRLRGRAPVDGAAGVKAAAVLPRDLSDVRRRYAPDVVLRWKRDLRSGHRRRDPRSRTC